MCTGCTDIDMYKGTTTCTCTLDQHKDCSRQIIIMPKVCRSFPQQPSDRVGGVRKGGGREIGKEKGLRRRRKNGEGSGREWEMRRGVDVEVGEEGEERGRKEGKERGKRKEKE